MNRTWTTAGLTLLLLASMPGAAVSNDVDELETCLQCHDRLAEEIKAAVPHPPAAGGECSSCHNPHVARFEKLLQDRPGPLCIACHGDTGAELEKILKQNADREVYVIGSGENFVGKERPLRRNGIKEVLESEKLRVVYEGRDGKTKIWKSLR